jgi:hypothetical protein
LLGLPRRHRRAELRGKSKEEQESEKMNDFHTMMGGFHYTSAMVLEVIT